jgi:hypothetical protein
MSEKAENIIVYIPNKKGSLSEKDIYWIDKFQTIISIGLKQIVKTDFNLNLEFEDFALKKKIGELLVIQMFLHNDFKAESVLNENSDSNTSGLINIYCDPEVEQSMGAGFSVKLYDEITEKKVDLSEGINDLKNEVWLKFLDITYKIEELFYHINKKPEEAQQNIYVAQTSKDQNRNRKIIIRELEHLGYNVLPHKNFSSDLISYSDMVHENIKESVLSVHIFGNNYTPINKNIEISGVELQNDIFIEVAEEMISQKKNIHRLVWIPPDLKPKSEKQKLYIESFKRNIELLRNTEIIQAPVEIFKNIIENKIIGLTSVKEEISISENKKANSVYIISSKEDEKYLKEIEQEFSKNKISVLVNANSQNKIDLLREHYHNLINCDGILIVYPNDNKQWLNSKLSDILKAPGFGRKKPFLFKTILHDSGNVPEFNIKINDLEFVYANGKSPNDLLKPIIEKFK